MSCTLMHHEGFETVSVISEPYSLISLGNNALNQSRTTHTMTTTTAPRSTFSPAALAASMAALTGGTSAAAAAAGTSDTKEKASIYIAVGILRDENIGVDHQHFDPSRDLINLPQMQGLDNMRPDTRKAGTVEFANNQAESNDLLDDLKDQALASMQPGERKIIPFYVTLYKVKEEVVAATPVERVKRQLV